MYNHPRTKLITMALFWAKSPSKYRFTDYRIENYNLRHVFYNPIIILLLSLNPSDKRCDYVPVIFLFFVNGQGTKESQMFSMVTEVYSESAKDLSW